MLIFKLPDIFPRIFIFIIDGVISIRCPPHILVLLLLFLLFFSSINFIGFSFLLLLSFLNTFIQSRGIRFASSLLFPLFMNISEYVMNIAYCSPLLISSLAKE